MLVTISTAALHGHKIEQIQDTEFWIRRCSLPPPPLTLPVFVSNYEAKRVVLKLARTAAAVYRIIKFSLLGIDFSASHMKT